MEIDIKDDKYIFLKEIVGEIKRINIGEWIDNYLDNNKDKVKNYDDRNLESLILFLKNNKN